MARWLGALLVVLAALLGRDARASVSIAVTWDGLLRESTDAVLVTPVEARSVWENGRIYTYTRARVDRVLVGGLTMGGEAWVRTMGGVVGDVGQVVDGEAFLAVGKPSLLFLHPAPVAAFDVTARGQGQFPLVADGKTPPHLVRNTSVGALVAPRAPAASAGVPALLAADRVHGRAVDDVALDVAGAWAAAHAR